MSQTNHNAPEAAIDPHRLAKHYLKAYATNSSGKSILRYWRQQWWTHKKGVYVSLTASELSVVLTEAVKRYIDQKQLTNKRGVLFSVSKNLVSNVSQALAGAVRIPE